MRVIILSSVHAGKNFVWRGCHTAGAESVARVPQGRVMPVESVRVLACNAGARALLLCFAFLHSVDERSEDLALIKQTTIAAPVETSGLGLHTAAPVRLRLRPAPPDTGHVFVRTDLDDFEIPASVECIAHCSYATTLMRTGVMLSTVEHLLAALRGLGVDNCYVEVDNLELPIMDGSAEAFTGLILRAGVVEQPAARRALRVRRRVEVAQGRRRVSIEPADGWEIDCLIDFPHPLIGVQRLRFDALDP